MPYGLIQRFETGTGPLAFSLDTLSQAQLRNRIADDLYARIEAPETIHQGAAPLCGPAAFMFCLAKTSPYAYARYVIDLAETGQATLGTLQVKPGKACRNARLGSRISAADWIALASLRDASNSVLAMAGPDSSTAGITGAATMAEWFQHCGLFVSVSNQAQYAPASLDRLLAADRHAGLGHFVCLLIRAAIVETVGGEVPLNKLGHGTPKTLLGTPDHWVVVQSPLRLGPCCYNPAHPPSVEALLKTRLAFSIYSWGLTTVNNRITDLTVGQFLPYFYGFVSAGHP